MSVCNKLDAKMSPYVNFENPISFFISYFQMLCNLVVASILALNAPRNVWVLEYKIS